MSIRYVVLLAGLCAAALIGGCSKPAVTVDGKGISKEKVNLHMKDRLREHKLQSASHARSANGFVDEKKMRDAIVQELIGEQLALNEAAAKGIKVADAEVDRQIDQRRKQLGEEQYQKTLKDKGMTSESYRSRLRERMILSHFVESFVKADEITEQEMKDFYQNSSKPFLKPARVFMMIVEFQTMDAANAAVAELKRTKTDFDDFAKKLETDKKASVTDYGWVSPDLFSPSMALSIKMLKEGRYGGPYKGKTGFYLVRVKERQNEGVSSFEEVKDSIRNTLLQQKRSALYMDWLEQKRKTAKIVINLK